MRLVEAVLLCLDEGLVGGVVAVVVPVDQLRAPHGQRDGARHEADPPGEVRERLVVEAEPWVGVGGAEGRPDGAVEEPDATEEEEEGCPPTQVPRLVAPEAADL